MLTGVEGADEGVRRVGFKFEESSVVCVSGSIEFPLLSMESSEISDLGP